jgi:hypothetical protein
MKVTLHVDISVDPLGSDAEKVKEIVNRWTETWEELGSSRVGVVAVDEVNVQRLIVEEE